MQFVEQDRIKLDEPVPASIPCSPRRRCWRPQRRQLDLGGPPEHPFWVDPQKRVAAVFMSQVLPFADKPALALYGRFEAGSTTQ